MVFVKIHASMLNSSIWLESAPTRLVWITVLVMADQNGVVEASVGGLARRAAVTREECEEAVRILTGPDPDDRSGVAEGRRMEKVPGGWLIVNHGSYRDIRTPAQVSTAARVKRHREKMKVASLDPGVRPVEALVYVIGQADGAPDSPSKLGISGNPWARLASIQTGNAAHLAVLETIKGTAVDETALHEILANCHMRGEWYPRDEALAALRRYGNEDNDLPASASVRVSGKKGRPKLKRWDEVRALPDFEALNGPDWHPPLDEWEEHLGERLPRGYTLVGAKRVLAQILQMGPDRFREAVIYSAAGNYQKLIEPSGMTTRRTGADVIREMDEKGMIE